MKSKLTFLLWLGLVLALSKPPQAWAGACISARFHDWRDLGCRMYPGGPGAPASGANNAGGNQVYCPDCPPPDGLPRWRVDEPYINLFITDEPLSYYTSSGQKMVFRWQYKQRYQLPLYDECPNFYSYASYGGPTWLGRTNGDVFLTDMRTYGMTNAAWAHNWMMDVVFWDTSWESEVIGSQNPLSVPTVFSQGYEALVFRPEGGMYYFLQSGSKSVLTDPQSNVRIQPLSSSGYPVVPYDGNPSHDTNGIYWGDAGMGFMLVYPDGSEDIFSLAFWSMKSCAPPAGDYIPQGSPPRDTTMIANSTAHAFLTQRIDPQGRMTKVGYEYTAFTNYPADPHNPQYYAYRVRYVVDPDLRTNTFFYGSNSPANPGQSAWQVAEIQDPYGRSASFTYDAGSGLLVSIADAVSNRISFAYQGDGSGWITNLTTPYGATSFAYYQVADPSPTATNAFSQRATFVSEPQGARQLFYYLHYTNILDASASSPLNPLGEEFDDGTVGSDPHKGLEYRNTFHWDRRQFSNLATNVQNLLIANALGTALADLSLQDFNKAGLKHWLWQTDLTSISESISSERGPSPDAAGQTEGPRIWYDYANKTYADAEGDPQIGAVARFLPDTTTQYSFYSYNPRTGLVQYNAETCSLANGSVGARTNWYQYAGNGIDLISITNSLGQWLNLGYNSSHQVTSATNALNQVTSLSWDSVSHNLTGVSLPSGQTNSLALYPDHGFAQSITLLPQGLTVAFPAYYAGLPQTVHSYGTGLPDLWLTNFWDGLNRLTATAFPDGTTTSNTYTRLDLTAQKDRLGNWSSFGYDGLQHLISITDALSNLTQLSWCECGALQTIIDPLTNPTTFNYNNQGLVTNIVFPDGSSLSYGLDALGRATNVADGLGRGFTYAYNNQGLITVVSNAYGPVWQAFYDQTDRPSTVTNVDGVTLIFQYDLLNRVTNRFWSDGIGESFVYATNGLIACTNRDGKATRFTRDGAGRLTAVTNANLEGTLLAYNALSQVTDLWDGRGNHTVWNYNQYGWLTNKADARGSNVLSFACDPNGQVTNRWTPQFGNTGYGYDAMGNLTTVTYPQSVVRYYYDPLNRLKSMTNTVGTNFFTYTAVGQLQSEEGPFGNDTLAIGYAQQLRQTLSLAQTGGTFWNQTYTNDRAFRLQTLTSPAGSFSYGYAGGPGGAASSLVRGVALPNNTAITNHYDSLDRLDFTALFNRWGLVLDGYSYIRDPLGLRTNITRNLGLPMSTVSLGYDAIGQLTAWSAVESNNVPRLHEQLGFGYDHAHNLSFRTNGALIQTFNSDVDNQLTNITRSGAFTLSGATPVPATNVTVNGLPAQRYGDFTFARTNLSLADGTNMFTNVAQNIYGLSATNVLASSLPASVNLQHDLNGNLTNDGIRSFAYDAENQLVTNWVAQAWRRDFVYDGLRRRRVEYDYTWQNGTWLKTNETRYVYDGLLIIQERDSNNAVRVTYTRGLDLSGSLQYAGGIGGLLGRTDTNGSAFYHTDGAGNVTLLVDGRQNMAARYLYNPFGKLTAQWGSLAPANRMQAWSMPADSAGGVHFLYRDYDTILQRFRTRDPIGEAGGINLYGFVHNSPHNRVDAWGLADGPGLLDQIAAASGDLGNYLNSEATRIRGDLGLFTEGLMRITPLVNTAIDLYEDETHFNFFHPDQRVSGLETGDRLLQDSLFGMLELTLALPLPRAMPVPCSAQGTKVFRVWGGEARPWGRSWTPADPRTILNYRNMAGLPDQNAGRFLSEGFLKDASDLEIKLADPLHGNTGGLPEFVLPSSESQVQLQHVWGLNPEF